jgi:hypothetical protein
LISEQRKHYYHDDHYDHLQIHIPITLPIPVIITTQILLATLPIALELKRLVDRDGEVLGNVRTET